MWYRYTDSLRGSVLRSLALCQSEGNAALSTRHLLLGLVYYGASARILRRLNPSHPLDQVVPPLLESSGSRNDTPGLTASARQVVDAAYAEAVALKDEFIGTEHLLLAMLRCGDSEAAAMLREAGVTLTKVAHELMQAHPWRTVVPEGGDIHASYFLGWRKFTQAVWGRLHFFRRVLFALTQITNDPVVYSFLFTRQRLEHPHQFFRRLRDKGLFFSRAAGGWVVSSYEDVQNCLREPVLSARRFDYALERGEPPLPPLIDREFNALWGSLSRQMLFQDAPEQTRARSLVSRQFTPRVLSAMRNKIQEVANELLDAAQAKDRMDVIEDFSFPLPATVIARLLGVDVGDFTQFKSWSDAFVHYISGNTTLTEELKAYQSMRALMDYFRNMIAAVRANPEETTLLSLMANAVDDEGNRLTDDEVIMNAMLLLAAGHETTTHLIANGLLLLLRHPEALRALQADPALMPGAVEEMLRCEGPVQWTSRIAREDFLFKGQPIRRGQAMNIALAAANRDPVRFVDPNRFDIHRKDNRHLSFGFGPHFCLGAALARMETEIALNTLLARFPGIRLAEEKAVWRHDFTFRAQKTMPVFLR